MSEYIPPTSSGELVLRWLRRCRKSQFAHYEMSVFYSKKNGFLGVPVILINALVSATIFATFLKSDEPTIRILALFLSVLAVILSALHNYLKFSDKAEAHRVAAAQYAAVRRKLEIMNIREQVAAPDLEKMEVLISDLALKAPTISAEQFDSLMRNFSE